jgi:hypothetical protein
VGCLSAYAQSQGLVGLDPVVFSAAIDLPGTLSRALIPTLIRDLGESGLIVKGISPFDAYVGILPSAGFVRAVLQDRSILHYVHPGEEKHLDEISPTLLNIAQHDVEQRWLTALGSAFLCVASGSGLSVSHFSKSLPEFDGKEKRITALLAALHDREVITLSTAGTQPEIFLSPSLLEQIEDGELVKKLRNPTRDPVPFAFVARERQRFGAVVASTAPESCELTSRRVPRHSKRVQGSLVMPPKPRSSSTSPSSTEGRRDGNRAGRDVRDRILGVFEGASSLKMGALMTALHDLNLTDTNVRYHVDLLCEKGALMRTGRGRGALISRAGTTQEVF